LENLISELEALRDSEFLGPGNTTLYSSYTQVTAELIVTTLLPNVRGEEISDLDSVVKIQNWLKNLACTGFILSVFNGESELTSELKSHLLQETGISSQWERMMVIQNMPLKFTREEIHNKVKKEIERVQGGVLDLEIDFTLPKDEDFEKRNGEIKDRIRERIKFEEEVKLTEYTRECNRIQMLREDRESKAREEESKKEETKEEVKQEVKEEEIKTTTEEEQKEKPKEEESK